jgi:hypothetical protein
VIKKETHQLRYLCDTKKNLFLKFDAESPGKCGMTKFYSLCPKYVVKATQTQECLCMQCTNLDLLCHAIWTNGATKKFNKEDLLAAIVCSKSSHTCAMRLCQNCKNLRAHDPTAVQLQHISYHMWEKDTRKNGTFCLEKTVTAIEGLQLFEKNLAIYASKFGEYISDGSICNVTFLSKPRSSFSYIGLLFLSTEVEAALHIDFSENWSSKRAKEVQSSHFGSSHSQVTIHQGIIYEKVILILYFWQVYLHSSFSGVPYLLRHVL